jgi:hypothetical protein
MSKLPALVYPPPLPRAIQCPIARCAAYIHSSALLAWLTPCQWRAAPPVRSLAYAVLFPGSVTHRAVVAGLTQTRDGIRGA